MSKEINKLNFFISYSHKNMKYKEKLLTSLYALKNTYNIEYWHDGMITAGNNIDDNVKLAMSKSHVVLLLITNDFLSSHYCINIELEDAIKREKLGQCIVIPVMFQEAVLTDDLAFIKNNMVPQDGKPIATGFKNQSQGCTRAVNMIKEMIDQKFPMCKKGAPIIAKVKSSPKSNLTVKKEGTSISRNVLNSNIPYIELYRSGKPSKIPVTQNMIDLIPKFHKYINEFKLMMDQSLLNNKKRYIKLYKSEPSGTLSNEQRLELLRFFLMDICAYTKTYITENVGIKVHFRVSKNGYYLGLIASTDDDEATAFF